MNVIFGEPFNNNDRRWPEFSNDGVRDAVINNGYVLESKSTGWWFASKPVAINQNDYFKIECTVKKVEGVDNFGYGLYFGGNNEKKNHYYFAISGDGRFTVTKNQEGVSTRLIPWAVPNSINRFNSTNKLTIEKKGSELLFLINDNFVGKIAFEPFFGNSIGFTVWNKQTIIFDDLVITQGK